MGNSMTKSPMDDSQAIIVSKKKDLNVRIENMGFEVTSKQDKIQRDQKGEGQLFIPTITTASGGFNQEKDSEDMYNTINPVRDNPVGFIDTISKHNLETQKKWKRRAWVKEVKLHHSITCIDNTNGVKLAT